ncbi:MULTISPECIES: hypothetical protein [Legionella]|uniref:Uncharacterized protein n=1 Tax=Legionella drozanskii LLAP-1 TaxID=1212489 RepID=A0A0W0TE60_9GAMM|nr:MULTISPECIES: hypothetical protein [Legionella]KTC93858.1 hypothetical protein Ldro_0208 [Legionella drozanskii LLAP-1]PJE10771.1 MAG: hypothetical protein CK430_09760 [Legionella sp.]
MRSKFHIFQCPWLKNFISACNKIESDPNYQPYITDRELLLLVVDENGDARHTPRRSALAIQPMDSIPLAADKSSLGALYQIKIAKKDCIDDSDYPVWYIDNSAVILINKKGEISLHTSENAKSGNFTSPLSHLSIEKFLNSPCLHYPEEKNNVYNF